VFWENDPAPTAQQWTLHPEHLWGFLHAL
jgi:hypothetical protein